MVMAAAPGGGGTEGGGSGVEEAVAAQRVERQRLPSLLLDLVEAVVEGGGGGSAGRGAVTTAAPLPPRFDRRGEGGGQLWLPAVVVAAKDRSGRSKRWRLPSPPPSRRRRWRRGSRWRWLLATAFLPPRSGWRGEGLRRRHFFVRLNYFRRRVAMTPAKMEMSPVKMIYFCRFMRLGGPSPHPGKQFLAI